MSWLVTESSRENRLCVVAGDGPTLREDRLGIVLVTEPSRANHLEQQCGLQGRRKGIADPDEGRNASSRTPYH